MFASTLNAGSVGQRSILRTSAPVRNFWSGRDGVRIAVWSDDDALHVESITGTSRPRRLVGPPVKQEDPVHALSFDAIGRWVVAAVAQQGLQMWDMTGPPDAEPIRLRRGAVTATTAAVFELSGRWLAAEDLRGVTLWPATRRWPSVLRVSANQPRDVAFDPGGKWIAAACRTGGVEIWPLTPDGPPRRLLVKGVQVTTLTVSPDGQFLATGTTSGSLLILPVSGSGSRELREFQGIVYAIAFDATGKRIAASARLPGGRSEIVRVFELRDGPYEGFRSGRRKGCRQCGLSSGWRPAHIKLWRIATRRCGNRILRTASRTAGPGVPRSRRPARPAPPHHESQLPRRVGFRCTTCASDAPGRSRATAIASRSWPGTLRERVSSLAAEMGSYGSVP